MAHSKSTRRIYLDNAATSWPKPECVYEAVDGYQREIGAPSGRSGSRAAEGANRIVERARKAIADLVGQEDSNRVIFTSSGTDSLNLAIRGIVRPGKHVVTTMCEHNSVLRPLRYLRDHCQVDVSCVSCDQAGFVSPEAILRALQPNTSLVALVHGSNVTGAIQPVNEIGTLVHDRGALFLIDAAQTLGHEPLSLIESHADLIAAPGHKGLLGPLGTGVLILGKNVEQFLEPLRLGGTGTNSESDQQPGELPYRYESGNLNIPGLAGLAAALDFLLEQGVSKLQTHHRQLATKLLEGLEEIPGITIYGPRADQPRTSVVSFTVAGYDPQELAVALEMSAGIECRAGMHCAPRMHESLGTGASGGTVRLSPGWATTLEEIDATLKAIAEIASPTKTRIDSFRPDRKLHG